MKRPPLPHGAAPETLLRREFLELAGYTMAGIALPTGALAAGWQAPRSDRIEVVSEPAPAGPGFLARYREHLHYDRVVRGTHNYNCWYQQNCAFHVFVRDGKVIREEQVGDYPQTRPDLPDFNPRGCQKGCGYSEFMYSPSRVLQPLKRAGARGEGRWQAVSWDQALGEIAEKIVTIIERDGPQAIVLDQGGNSVSQIALESVMRFFDLLDSTMLDVNCELGDDQQGGSITYGGVASDRSADDYFHSDLILIWGGNPAFTQIPNFHFLSEARYNGTEIIAISPDLNASAIHADLWVPVKPGTDSALALSMARVMIDENLHDVSLIREQTDLPFLVRVDNGKFLRESDLKDGGSGGRLYRWDTVSRKPVPANMRTLALDGEVPALEGRFRVSTPTGEVDVEPVFSILRRQLAAYAPEAVAETCGVAPDTIRLLARKLARAKAATNTCTSGLSKYYHGDLLMRSQILVFTLCGQLGRPGAGYVTASVLLPSGSGRFFEDMRKYREAAWPVWREYGPAYLRNRRAMSYEDAVYTYLEDASVPSRMFLNSTLFWNLHGGLYEISGRSNDWDPYLKRDVGSYLDEALRKQWQVARPMAYYAPKALFFGAGNSLRRVRGSQKLLETLWPKLDLVVAMEVRMSSTALHADYILPVSGAYEKTTVMALNTNPLAPFLHTTVQAVPPVGESRDDWAVVCLLAKKIQALALERGGIHFTSGWGNTRSLHTIYDEMVGDGIKENEGEKLSRRMVELSSNLDGVTWDDLKSRGYARFTGLGDNPANFSNACDIGPGETIVPHTHHVRDRKPWLTLSGRVQFYIDHDWYLELGQALPVHKDPPMSGGRYPITMTGGHTRWSIHASQRADPLMLRLQRGEPCLWMSMADARARGIADGDRIAVFNDIGRFVTRARLSVSIRPGQAVIYHAWENYQFEGGIGPRAVQASPLNPIEMVGDYPHIKPVLGLRQPGQSDRDTRIEIERLPSGEAS